VYLLAHVHHKGSKTDAGTVALCMMIAAVALVVMVASGLMLPSRSLCPDQREVY